MEHLSGQIEFLGATADGDKPKRRRFRMVGYTGAAVHGGSFAFDASGFKHKQKLPILLEHDPEKRAAYADQIEVRDGQVHLEGYMLSNDYATGLLSDMDEGFPFEASIGLTDIDWEHVARGETAELNGQSVEGPLSIGRRARLAEVSFVTAGADANTEAVALSRRAQSNQQEADVAKQDPDAVALIAEKDSKIAELSTKLAQLEAAKADADAQLSALRDAERARKEKAAADYVGELKTKSVELQAPIPEEDLERVAKAFARGDDETAQSLGAAYLSRSEALSKAAQPAGGKAVDLGTTSAGSAEDQQAFLASVLRTVGVDPDNPKRIKV